MRLAIGVAQGGVGEVGVDLRRLEVGVAEQLLHDSQVGAALEQMRRERVTQGVRAGPLRRAGGSTQPPTRAARRARSTARRWR